MTTTVDIKLTFDDVRRDGMAIDAERYNDLTAGAMHRRLDLSGNDYAGQGFFGRLRADARGRLSGGVLDMRLILALATAWLLIHLAIFALDALLSRLAIPLLCQTALIPAGLFVGVAGASWMMERRQ